MPPARGDDPDEDDVVLDAFVTLREEFPLLLLLLVPRRPERFASAAEKLARGGVRFLRRSQLTERPALALPGALLVDTIGELNSLFPLADVVFMGGTLVDRGGHNILEPAFHAVPIASGPNLQNFAEIAAEFRTARALSEVPTAADLAPVIAGLLRDPQRRRLLGATGQGLAHRHAGAVDRALEHIQRLRELALPRPVHTLARRLVLGPLTLLWRAGARLDHNSRRLPAPVISIGNLSAGGSGKTPFALFLARQLHQRGWRPAFLTRGYRRRSPAPVTVFAPGATAPVWETGDEAQILVRSGLGPVGIAADRHRAGIQLFQQFKPDVFLLDDGFQHRRLHRDLDIVLVDSLDPFPGGALLPLGHLREPLHALARAHAFVLTRTQPGRGYGAILEILRRHNEVAPVFHARTRPLRWIDRVTGDERAIDGPCAAFCGLANPDSFWQSLRELGIALALRFTFGDHHRYRPQELRRMAIQAQHAGAKVLLTTQKDVFNAPEGAAPLPVYWLEMEMVVEEADAFQAWLVESLTAVTAS